MSEIGATKLQKSQKDIKKILLAYLEGCGKVGQNFEDGELLVTSYHNSPFQHLDSFSTTLHLAGSYKWGPPRDDGRCGAVLAADCDANGPYPCCSRFGYCGNTEGHCKCDQCTDFRVGPEEPRFGK